MKKNGISTKKAHEKAVLIGIITAKQNKDQALEYIDELDFLARTAGAVVVEKFLQKLDRPDNKSFVGSGKLQEIAAYIEKHEIDIAIFDDELSASQIRNIENAFKCKILDRTNLILDIFASRAKTAYSRTQVELAQYEYLLPRLTGMWSHLQKQRGGIGMKGPGEKEIETDRRIIRDRISKLKKELIQIDKQKQTQRKHRAAMVRVALVGYTNVGKSTLMNAMSKSNVFAENKLFATLDTTVRKVTIEHLAFLLGDTVGFIRKLPHHLVESFKSTLDEIREADLLLHVVDISHPNFEEHIETVQSTLNDIGAGDKPYVMVFNKCDALKMQEAHQISFSEFNIDNQLSKTWMSHLHGDSVFISALKKRNMDKLRKMMFDKVKNMHEKRYPGTLPYY